MTNKKWVLLNNQLVSEQEAFIPISDRGFLFGEGIFTTIRVNEGVCELLPLHIERLRRQAKILNFSLSEILPSLIQKLLLKNDAERGIWRLKMIFTIKENRGRRLTDNFIVTLSPYVPPESSVRLTLFPYPYENPLAEIKSLSYLNQLFIYDKAVREGYDDAVICSHEGYILETSRSNLFWIAEGKCWIPHYDLPYLKGVFLEFLVGHLPFPVQYDKCLISEIPIDACVYICNALTHVRPVSSIKNYVFKRKMEMEAIINKTVFKYLNII